MATAPAPARRRYSTGAVLAMLAFAACIVVALVAFAQAAWDGEQRRTARLVELLHPDYTGDDRLAPDFTLNDRAGRPFRLSTLRGRTVVLHFWSRDCPPCIRELAESLPVFDQQIRGRRDLALVLVSPDADWAGIAPLVPPGLRAPVLLDPTRAVIQGRYGTRLFPETWIIDPRGVIRARFDHVLEWGSPAFAEFLATIR